MWGEVTWGRWQCASAFPGYDKNPLQGLCAVDDVRAGESCGRCGRFHQPADARPFADGQAGPLAIWSGANNGGSPAVLGHVASPRVGSIFRCGPGEGSAWA
jgi:hypothetical protein